MPRGLRSFTKRYWMRRAQEPGADAAPPEDDEDLFVEPAELTPAGLEVAERDLALRGVPITRADAETVGTTASILTERRLAVTWLQGYDALYSEGDTNT
jgi:hypothetical protein